MTIHISFPAELEDVLRRRAADAGVDVETFIQEAVAERLGADTAPERPRRSPEEFRAAIQRIIDMHPGSGGHLDDSRESIYAGRE